MQESISITENWESASSNTAVMWAISHVITNIRECVKSKEKTTKMEDGLRESTKTNTGWFKILFY